MGFGTSATEAILFIGAVLIAVFTAGVLGITSYKMADGIREKGVIIGDRLKTDFEIINDPENIPVQSGRYVFYIKNTGKKNFYFTNDTITVLIDGQIIPKSNLNVQGSSGALRRSDVGTISVSTSLSSGYHTLRVVLFNGVTREFVFRI